MSRWLQAILIMTFVLLAVSCQEENELDELIRQSPFKDVTSEPKEEILIVSCQFYPLELPGQVDVLALPFWEEHAAAGNSAEDDTASGSGFTMSQLKTWRDNGFHLAVAPLEDWAQLRQELLEVGGVAQSSTISIIRRPWDLVVYPVSWTAQSTSVFVASPAGPARGYTLDPGDCIFSINCTLNSAAQSLYLKIVPEFHAVQSSERFDRDAFGVLKRIIETPRIVFEQLTLEGQLPQEQFICIAARSQPRTAGNLGQLFLTRTDGVNNYQLVLILYPQVQTGTEIRARLQE